jgi:hypothetical protein
VKTIWPTERSAARACSLVSCQIVVDQRLQWTYDMTPNARFFLAVPVLAIAQWFSACSGDNAPVANRGLIDHGSLEGLGIPTSLASVGLHSASTRLQASDASAGDVYGAAVALSRDGNTLAVGADIHSGRVPAAGAVYVYERTLHGWREIARLYAPVPSSGSGFGHSLALSDDGTRLAVGAPFESHPNDDQTLSGDQGVVHVFERSGRGWGRPTRLVASNAGSHDWFGMSLSFSGAADALAVGAHRHDTLDAQGARSDSGAVYVFAHTGAGWAQQAVLTAAQGQQGAQLGKSVALSVDGLTLAAAAPASGLGAVHVFRRDGARWTEQAVVTAPNGVAENPLGSQVALSADGTTLAVGASATHGSDNLQPAVGSAYVFVNDAGQWRQQARIRPSNAGAGGAFGERLDLSADGRVLAVSAVAPSAAGPRSSVQQVGTRAQAAGAVYVFSLQGRHWAETGHVTSSRARPGDFFGSALALSGDGRELAVGARLEDGTPGLLGRLFGERLQGSGGVYLYSRI